MKEMENFSNERNLSLFAIIVDVDHTICLSVIFISRNVNINLKADRICSFSIEMRRVQAFATNAFKQQTFLYRIQPETLNIRLASRHLSQILSVAMKKSGCQSKASAKFAKSVRKLNPERSINEIECNKISLQHRTMPQ